MRARCSAASFQMVAVWLVAAGAAAAPADEAANPVAVRIHDYAAVPPTVLSSALEAAAGILRRAGLQPAFSVERRRTGVSRATETAPATLTIIIPLDRMSTRISANPVVLGTTPAAGSGGRLAYVFADRVNQLARLKQANEGQLLGIVIAHEIGHMLLGPPHATTGLMRPMCDRRQLRAIALGQLRFTPDEEAIIRHRSVSQ
jgi:hypothetical protein